jgi:TonB family protein
MARSTGSLAISLGVHAAVFALAFSLARHPSLETSNNRTRDHYDDGIVWLPAPGPGGGGGGGGNERAEPIRKLEVQGQDTRTMPVSKAPDMNPEDMTPPESHLVNLAIPAVEFGAADFSQIGVREGLPASDSQGPGTDGGAGTGARGGIGPGDGRGLDDGSDGNTGGDVYGVGSGADNPRVLYQVKPQYTAQAMRVKIQGEVLLECVVESDGTVGRIRVLRSLDSMFGLDQEAIKAARQWRFAPARLKGRPVAMRVTIGIAFALR